MTDISYSQLNKIAGAKFAIEAEVEQRQFALAVTELKAYSDRPDFLQLKWRLLTDNLSLVPWFEM